MYNWPVGYHLVMGLVKMASHFMLLDINIRQKMCCVLFQLMSAAQYCL